MHKFTHLERRCSIFETPPLSQIQEKQLNRHFEPSFDFREGFSDAATVGSGIMDVGRGPWVVLHARWPDMRGGVRGGGERG
ncbi:Protein disks lost [Gossypium arboreum]|uniref:Protein disks lost n=1 Tax=Gossypium arboreum TaxID=29729 RepID=A0A0B0MW67_GOSAR|nr:Protein disks lost [Gossypium arboreum]